MKKIVFGITCLKLGGAERVLVDIVNKLSNKYDITIFTLYSNGEFEKELNDKVKLESMYDCTYNELSFLEKKLLSLKLVTSVGRKSIYDKFIKGKYDVEISFLEGPITWIFSEGTNNKIAWIHNDIADVFGTGSKATKKKELSGKCYLKFNKLIFVSKDNLDKFNNVYPDNNVDKEIIYNYLDVQSVIKKSNLDKVNDIKKDMVSFLQVSRLVDQKAVGRLIDVHKKLIDDGFNHRIYVIGDGPLEDELRSKVKSLKLEDTFVLLGKKSNPYPYISEADYFMLTSYYEGYGMVIVEAEILNKYIMITDSAAREAVQDYKDSLIVKNNEDGIYDGIKSILKDKPKVKNDKVFNNDSIIDDIIKMIEGEL